MLTYYGTMLTDILILEKIYLIITKDALTNVLSWVKSCGEFLSVFNFVLRVFEEKKSIFATWALTNRSFNYLTEGIYLANGEKNEGLKCVLLIVGSKWKLEIIWGTIVSNKPKKINTRKDKLNSHQYRTEVEWLP